ncbi:uncharacterized protein LOC108147080 [Drosophila elegans]|uniref:uncharacterized protein LOC108147080 n=1 Tax=Drosophila elegans TaxID=30023 RepID=UPI0007E8A444|nr:uncharacterized protein LOC108147080 [Drosophila elegans]
MDWTRKIRKVENPEKLHSTNHAQKFPPVFHLFDPLCHVHKGSKLGARNSGLALPPIITYNTNEREKSCGKLEGKVFPTIRMSVERKTEKQHVQPPSHHHHCTIASSSPAKTHLQQTQLGSQQYDWKWFLKIFREKPTTENAGERIVSQ